MYFTPPIYQAIERNGSPVPMASVQFFAGLSDVPLVVFRDAALADPHPPLILSDIAGRFPAIFLPVATAAVPTFRVRCLMPDGSPIYEASGLDLPAAPVSASTASSYALPLIPCVDDGGNLSITLTSATFAGLLSVNASASDVQVQLPSLASLSPVGRNLTVRQIGQGSAVVVFSPSAAAPIDGSRGFPLTDFGEQVTIVATSVDFRAIGWNRDDNVIAVVARLAAPPAGPVAGGWYIATAASGAWTSVGTLYRADGVGGWIAVSPRVGMVAIVMAETFGGLKVPYQWTGTAWAIWPGFSAVTTTPVVAYRSALSGAFPPTAKGADIIVDDTVNPDDLWLWTPSRSAYELYSTGVFFKTGTTASALGVNAGLTAFTPPVVAEIPAKRLKAMEIAIGGPGAWAQHAFRVKGATEFPIGAVEPMTGTLLVTVTGTLTDTGQILITTPTGTLTVAPTDIVEIGLNNVGNAYASTGANFTWTIRDV